MTLSFAQQINGQPTYFPEKVLIGLNGPISSEAKNYHQSAFCNLPEKFCFESKLHTIRKDEKNRWKVGSKIHMVINNRTKNRLQFAPILEVKAIQKIKIQHLKLEHTTKAHIYIDGVLQGFVIWVHCQLKSSSFTVDAIAKNDGFDTTNSFFEWFSEDFEGKIIHWTDLKY
jgi:hypothetical protein